MFYKNGAGGWLLAGSKFKNIDDLLELIGERTQIPKYIPDSQLELNNPDFNSPEFGVNKKPPAKMTSLTNSKQIKILID